MSDGPNLLRRHASILGFVLGAFRGPAQSRRSGPLAASPERCDESARPHAVSDGQRTIDAAVAAYVGWRAACTAVHDAYRHWACAPAGDAQLAYAAYGASVDREQAAAEMYSRLMGKVGHLVESGLDYPLTATLWARDQG
jgi:hypothetical protein